MITIDFTRFPVQPGTTFLDVGCGQGRHSYAALRRGAVVTAFDANGADLAEVDTMFQAMRLEGEWGPGSQARVVQGDARRMPFEDASFDRVLASEILEHVPDDEQAMAELARVVRPGGLVAVTVPRWWPEKVCWALSDEYHEVEGGHVRIYRRSELVRRLEATGLEVVGGHHAHALHAPYWWLKCAVGTERETRATRAYHRLLVWDLLKAPRTTRWAERALDPLVGKSVVVYLRRPETA